MQRRTFLKWMTHGLGAAFAAALGIPAIAYLVDPLRRKAAPATFRPVAKLSDLKVNEPVQAVIRETRRDTYTTTPNELVGRVYLIRRDAERVEAFTMECPHLGCAINLNDDKQGFTCPCHQGQFALNGKCIDGPPPRGMDSLPCRLVRLPLAADAPPDAPATTDQLVEVEFLRFINNIPEKVVRT